MKPAPYRMRVYPYPTLANPENEPSRTSTSTTFRAARVFVRKAALDAGLGARGEVLTGETFTEVAYSCRVTRNATGKLTIHEDDV